MKAYRTFRIGLAKIAALGPRPQSPNAQRESLGALSGLGSPSLTLRSSQASRLAEKAALNHLFSFVGVGSGT